MSVIVKGVEYKTIGEIVLENPSEYIGILDQAEAQSKGWA